MSCHAYLFYNILPVFAKNIKVEALSDFSTVNPPSVWEVKVLEGFIADNGLVVVLAYNAEIDEIGVYHCQPLLLCVVVAEVEVAYGLALLVVAICEVLYLGIEQAFLFVLES